ncbi:cytokine receptor-like [Planococcus citri]|uniref:cytokine receptor-like n=1 Tax=Planococcus citri TaxID=170843 RepID=UPI0031F9CDB3
MRHWSIAIFWYFFMKLNLAIGLTHYDSDSNQKCFASGGMISPAWRAPIPDVDIILEVGTSLEIYCTLDLNYKHCENYTSQDIIFKKGDRKIDSEHVTLVNSTTARLFLETSTISVQTEIFACLLTLQGGGNTNATSEVFNHSDSGAEKPLINDPKSPAAEDLICSSSVRIGSRPKKVVNFKCLSHNWDVLDCWWHEPNNGIETRYSIYYSIPEEAGKNQFYGCPTDQSEPGHCRWTKETSPPYKENFEFMNFYINGSNMLGNITQMSRWNHYAHVIPARPRNLIPLRITSHSVCLQWDDVSSWNASLMNLLYLVKYKRLSSKSWNIIHFHSADIEKENDHVQVNITGIKYPNMEYKFQVYVKFNVSKKNSWSKAASVLVKTSACAPYRSPKTDPGGFEVFAEYSNRRNAIVYWKQIPNEEHNGDNFQYRIIVFENDEKFNIKPTSMNNFSATFSNLSFNAYKFYIRSVNAIGSAPRSSIVYVPKQNDILPQPMPGYKRFDGTDVYEITVLSGLLEFKYTFRQIEVTNFTLFWCESNHGDPYPCSNVFNWINLPVNNIISHNFAFMHNVTLNQHMGYQFAVSTNSLNSSSGMSWIIYTGIYNQVNKIQNVWIQEVGSSFVDIHWKLEFANRVQGFKGYKISYCPVNENHQHDCVESTEKHLKYHAGKNVCDFNFTNLMPNTTYKMAVAVWTGELLGPWSEWMYPRTKNAP